MNSSDITKPLVSVIMPTYNYARFIGESVKSVLAQTYRNFELIIVDNYSTDDTEKIVRDFKDERIKYFKFSNQGVIAASRNKGIKEAKGDLIAFLDSDDLWLPEKLDYQIELLNKNQDVGMVYCRAESFGANQRNGIFTSGLRYNYQGLVFDELLKHNFIGTLTVLLRKKCLEDIGFFDEDPELKTIEDYELWLRIAHKHKIGFVEKILAKYRIHGKNTSGTILESRKLWLKVVHKIDSKIGISAVLKNKILGIVHLEIAKEYILLKDYENALKEIKISVETKANLISAIYRIVVAIGLGGMLRALIIFNRKS